MHLQLRGGQLLRPTLVPWLSKLHAVARSTATGVPSPKFVALFVFARLRFPSCRWPQFSRTSPGSASEHIMPRMVCLHHTSRHAVAMPPRVGPEIRPKVVAQGRRSPLPAQVLATELTLEVSTQAAGLGRDLPHRAGHKRCPHVALRMCGPRTSNAALRLSTATGSLSVPPQNDWRAKKLASASNRHPLDVHLTYSPCSPVAYCGNAEAGRPSKSRTR